MRKSHEHIGNRTSCPCVKRYAILPAMLRNILFSLVCSAPFLLPSAHANLAKDPPSAADTLRGSIGPYRAWWDVQKYDIRVRPDFGTRSLVASNTIYFQALSAGQRMQIDLQQPLIVDSITTDLPLRKKAKRKSGERKVEFERDGNVIWATLPDSVAIGAAISVTVYYHGTPRVAKNPPWDGGWIWTRDDLGNPWMSVACQGLGASSWYPCKDHQSDKAERAAMHITVPDSLVGVSNGRFRGTSRNRDGTSTWHWAVNSPISAYNLVPYIGKYSHFNETFQGENGALTLDYWVLEQHEAKAREHFEQVPVMLACFEHWMGPYPFYKDGYKLVEAPHLGMEHQSGIAYGNRFMNGYLGRDLSGTGHGLKWDFIIVHESGHEWFGNNITTADIADMWVHEGFTQYSEALMTEYMFGKTAGEDYVIGLREGIRNDKPIIGPYGVNEEGSGDMYTKGANLVHLIRQLFNDDTQFRQLLRYMNQRFQQSVVTTAQVEDFIDQHLTMDLKPMFDQYLRHTEIPVLEWYVESDRLWYRWSNCIPNFEMPVRLAVAGRDMEFYGAGTAWRALPYAVPNKSTLSVDRNWYVGERQLSKLEVKGFGR